MGVASLSTELDMIKLFFKRCAKAQLPLWAWYHLTRQSISKDARCKKIRQTLGTLQTNVALGQHKNVKESRTGLSPVVATLPKCSWGKIQTFPSETQVWRELPWLCVTDSCWCLGACWGDGSCLLAATNSRSLLLTGIRMYQWWTGQLAQK